MFQVAWNKAFTEANIQSAFYKAGIWPINGIQIIDTIARTTGSSLNKASGIKPPKPAKSIRLFRIDYEKDPSEDKVKILFNTTLQLSAQVAILTHENEGLCRAIDLQKKKNNKKGVRLNLCGE
jgi:hypothetical protein